MVKKEILSSLDAVKFIKPGQTIMSGGFMGCGAASELLTSLKELGTKELTLISTDCGWYLPDQGKINGVAENVLARQFSKVIASHIGLNIEIQRQMIAGETEVELVPQGTLAERIRSGGYGIGGFLTPTGVGTEVEEGKQVFEIKGKKYLLELPLSGDVALIHAEKADRAGNLLYARSARNFNPLMAMACDTVIVQANEIVEVGELDPATVVTPSIFVNYLVETRDRKVM